jgi:hypothetical protein
MGAMLPHLGAMCNHTGAVCTIWKPCRADGWDPGGSAELTRLGHTGFYNGTLGGHIWFHSGVGTPVIVLV